MSLLAIVLFLILILVIREEILSYTYRRQIKEAEKEYLLWQSAKEQEEFWALPVPEKQTSEERLLNAPSKCVKKGRDLRKAA
jgi:hypothetical protein